MFIKHNGIKYFNYGIDYAINQLEEIISNKSSDDNELTVDESTVILSIYALKQQKEISECLNELKDCVCHKNDSVMFTSTIINRINKIIKEER